MLFAILRAEKCSLIVFMVITQRGEFVSSAAISSWITSRNLAGSHRLAVSYSLWYSKNKDNSPAIAFTNQSPSRRDSLFCSLLHWKASRTVLAVGRHSIAISWVNAWMKLEFILFPPWKILSSKYLSAMLPSCSILFSLLV